MTDSAPKEMQYKKKRICKTPKCGETWDYTWDRIAVANTGKPAELCEHCYAMSQVDPHGIPFDQKPKEEGMRIHFVLNQGQAPESKLADVEIHFEDGPLAGLKLVGCSVWRSKKEKGPTVLVPSRSYATAGGVRYYDLLRGALDGGQGLAENEADNKKAVNKFKDYIRDEYLKIRPKEKK